MGTSRYAVPVDVYTYQGRLASFDITYQFAKPRTSSTKAKGQMTLSWPHKNPSAKKLAMAGFFYRPTAGSSDSVECFLCHKALDGWEEEDDPVTEHLTHSPNCGWAINLRIDQKPDGTKGDNEEDPLCEKMIEARRATFADRWPHEHKKGWTCKVRKMVDSGWFYSPTPDSDDFVTCAYCGLALDGWEPKDDPLEEHHKRSDKCPFFTMALPPPAAAAVSKPTKAKKGRVSKAISKASRSSIQSANWEIFSGNSSLADIVLDEGNSMMSTLSTVSRQTATGRKIAASKGKKTRAKKEEPVEPTTHLEPEDDSFEVKVFDKPARAQRGKKRKTEEINVDAFEDPVTQPVPPKRRATRTRGSLAQVQAAPILISDDEDFEMNDSYTSGHAPTKKSGKAGRPNTRAKKTRSSVAPVSVAPVSVAPVSVAPVSVAPVSVAPVSVAPVEIASIVTSHEKGIAVEDADVSGHIPAKEGAKAGQPRGRATRIRSSVVQAQPIPVVMSHEDIEMGEADALDPVPAKKAGRAGRPKAGAKKLSGSVAQLETAPVVMAHEDSVTTGNVDTSEHVPAKKAGKVGRPKRNVSQTSDVVAQPQIAPVAVDVECGVEMDDVDTSERVPAKKTGKAGRPKGRATRTRSSVAQAERTLVVMSHEGDTEMNDADALEQAPPKKAGKAGRKSRASSAKPRGGKASNALIASKTPIIADNMPDDAEIERALEADLDRPLSDEEVEEPHKYESPVRGSDEENQPPQGLKTSHPWRKVDLETIFSPRKPLENVMAQGLCSPEKKMTVYEWINYNAQREADKLTNECEALVGIFERQANKAMEALQGLEIVAA